MTIPARRLLAAALIVLGLACLGWVAALTLRRADYQHQAEQALRRETARPTPPPAPARVPHGGVVGRLEIPRVHLSVIVAEGDDEATLEKAAGHLPDTALPWEGSNSAVAGHRDTLFRPLRSVRVGDEIRLATRHGTFDYRIRRTFVTTPDDIGVLAPSASPELTLVTCYPFHYVGAAPKRYIVQAERIPGVDEASSPRTEAGRAAGEVRDDIVRVSGRGSAW